MDLTAKIQEEGGMYWADVQGPPGCFASGGSIPGLIEALEEAVSLYLMGPEAQPVVTRVAFTGLHADRGPARVAAR